MTISDGETIVYQIKEIEEWAKGFAVRLEEEFTTANGYDKRMFDQVSEVLKNYKWALQAKIGNAKDKTEI